MQTLAGKTIAIHFMSKIENSDYYIYEVEIENTTDSEAIYDMQNLYCTNGYNVLDAENFDVNLLNGKQLLLCGFIAVNGEKVGGCVAFEKNIKFVNQSPTFEYDDITFLSYSQQITL